MQQPSGKHLPAHYSKLLFALLGILFALFVVQNEVSAQVQILYPAQDSTVSALTSQGVTARSAAGFDAALYVNGVLSQKKKVRVDELVDFINVQVPQGDVTLEVRILNPDGSTAFLDSRFMHILGAPAKVKLSFDSDRLPADGSSAIQGKAVVYDQWGYVIPGDVTLTMKVDSGQIVTPDYDSTRNGLQIRVVNGQAEFTYQAGNAAGFSHISVSVGQVSATHEIFLDTPKEPFTLIGLATGKGGMYSAKGNRSVLADEKTFPDGFDSDGRLAVYARGTVYGDWLLTGSFDSDRKNRAKFFRELDPDYLYSIYGDNSMLYYDIQTNRNLFIKIERNQTYGLFGDYNTALTGQEFVSYNRTLNGLKVGHKDKNWDITGFGSLTDRRAVQVELRGLGLSGFYNLGYTDVTPGSEKVRIETRDKFHSEILLKSEDKFRYSDYDIDYEQGTLFFKQPVPAVDQSGNPVYIMISFEAVTGTASSYIVGARVANRVLNNLSIGVTGVTEEQTPKNFTLLGADAQYQLSSNISLSGEVANSSYLGGNGTAYKVETKVTPLDNLNMQGYYRNVGKGFSNVTQINGTRELGTEKYGVGANYSMTPQSRIAADYYHTSQISNSGGTNNVNSISASLNHKFTNNFGGQLKVEDVGYSGTNPDTTKAALTTHSTLASAKLDYKASNRLTFSALHDRNLSTNIDVTRPNATSLMGEYKVTDDITIQGQEKFIEGGGQLSTIGLSTNVSENTQAYGKYEIGNAIGQYRNQISIGLKNRVKLTDDLTGYLGYEKTKGLGQRVGEAQTQDHSAYSASIEYLPKLPIKVTSKAEFGENSITDKINITFAGDYHFERDFSAIVKYLLADESSKKTSGYRTQNHLITGLAYRPIDFDWLNVIAKYEVKQDKNHYLAPFIDYYSTIISIHAFVEPIQRLELGLKYAHKTAEETSPLFDGLTNTNFYLIRGEYDIDNDWSVGAEYRLLHQLEVGDMLNGYSADVSYAIIKNVRLTAGYNFKGYSERDLVDYTLWSRGPFLKFSWKFTEALLGW